MGRRAFTLVEMIVVIAVIGILAGLLLPALLSARARAREKECMSQLKQIGYLLEMYRQEHKVGVREQNPHRLTHLVDGNKVNPKLFICPSDRTDGKQGGKPDLPEVDQFKELDEPGYHLPSGPRLNEYPLSYMYEFSGAECGDWWKGYLTLPGMSEPDFDWDAAIDINGNPGFSSWGEVKFAQMRFGDTSFNLPGQESTWRGYPESGFPVLRCFWHADDPNTPQGQKQILNLSYSGVPFKSQAKWELDAFR
jgi:prepilin-type N-terminal cleavage/methylation domain-containing protein